MQKNLCSQGVFPLLQPSSITPFSFLPNSGHPTTLRVLHVVLDTRPMSILWNEVMQVILQVACWMSRVARRALHAVLGVGRWALGVGFWALGFGHWALGAGRETKVAFVQMNTTESNSLPSMHGCSLVPKCALCPSVHSLDASNHCCERCRGVCAEKLLRRSSWSCDTVAHMSETGKRCECIMIAVLPTMRNATDFVLTLAGL